MSLWSFRPRRREGALQPGSREHYQGSTWIPLDQPGSYISDRSAGSGVSYKKDTANILSQIDRSLPVDQQLEQLASNYHFDKEAFSMDGDKRVRNLFGYVGTKQRRFKRPGYQWTNWVARDNYGPFEKVYSQHVFDIKPFNPDPKDPGQSFPVRGDPDPVDGNPVDPEHDLYYADDPLGRFTDDIHVEVQKKFGKPPLIPEGAEIHSASGNVYRFHNYKWEFEGYDLST
jgi:hypothetical protein